MVKKKGGSKKKKSKEVEPVTQVQDVDGVPVPTTTGAKKKSTAKSKKAKPTRQSKALEQLNKFVEIYKKDKSKYDVFVGRIDKWFTDNQIKIMGLFSRFDTSNVGELTYDQFKAGMLDADIPCNMIELHLLTTLLDSDGNGTIDYSEFTQGVRYFRQVEADASAVEKADMEDPIQLVGPWEPKWANVSFKLVTFEQYEKHPCHFEELIPLNLCVDAVCNVIRQRTLVSSNDIYLFTDNTRSPQSTLTNDDRTLREQGVRGGPKYNPRDVEIFYDYRTGSDPICPILQCDYYFIKPEKRT